MRIEGHAQETLLSAGSDGVDTEKGRGEQCRRVGRQIDHADIGPRRHTVAAVLLHNKQPRAVSRRCGGVQRVGQARRDQDRGQRRGRRRARRREATPAEDQEGDAEYAKSS